METFRIHPAVGVARVGNSEEYVVAPHAAVRRGTIYQAFLSALSYHRWHSPVGCRIVKAYVQEGTYYSETLAEGFDPAGPNDSQAYITEVAARAMMFIEAVKLTFDMHGQKPGLDSSNIPVIARVATVGGWRIPE